MLKQKDDNINHTNRSLFVRVYCYAELQVHYMKLMFA